MDVCTYLVAVGLPDCIADAFADKVPHFALLHVQTDGNAHAGTNRIAFIVAHDGAYQCHHPRPDQTPHSNTVTCTHLATEHSSNSTAYRSTDSSPDACIRSYLCANLGTNCTANALTNDGSGRTHAAHH